MKNSVMGHGDVLRQQENCNSWLNSLRSGVSWLIDIAPSSRPGIHHRIYGFAIIRKGYGFMFEFGKSVHRRANGPERSWANDPDTRVPRTNGVVESRSNLRHGAHSMRPGLRFAE